MGWVVVEEISFPEQVYRVDGWESILHKELEFYRTGNFDWGVADCASFAANIVLSITGVDFYADYRGLYTNEEEALKLIRKAGGLRRAVSKRVPQQPVAYARRGDVMQFNGALGICEGMDSYFMTPTGFMTVKTLDCKTSWKIGI